MILSSSLCGHFTLGTFSNTYLKNAVFEMNAFTKKSPNVTNSKNVKFDSKMKKVWEPDVILAQLTRFHVHQIMLFYFSFFWGSFLAYIWYMFWYSQGHAGIIAQAEKSETEESQSANAQSLASLNELLNGIHNQCVKPPGTPQISFLTKVDGPSKNTSKTHKNTRFSYKTHTGIVTSYFFSWTGPIPGSPTPRNDPLS